MPKKRMIIEVLLSNRLANEAEISVPCHQRKKAGRKPLPAHLPLIREEHDLPEDEKVCSCCGSQNLHWIGEEVSEQLDFTQLPLAETAEDIERLLPWNLQPMESG